MPIFGIVTSIATALGGAFTFLSGGGALASIVKMGLGLAAQYAAQHFFGPKSPPAQASQLETRYGEKLARDIVQGTVGTAGHHIYRNAYGKGNTIVQDVFVLSHWNIAGVNRVRFKGEWKTLGGAIDAERGQRIQNIDAEVWVKIYTGRMDQAADAGLIARSNPPGRWTANHRGAGVAYAIVTNVLTRDHLPGPWEAFFEVVGVTYDMRRDDSVGGAGSQRYNDPTTWEPTSNPMLMAYCATRGFWRGDQKIVGKGRSASTLPLAQWTQAVNICDEYVDDTRRYQAACILSSGEGITHDANLQPLLEASAASWIELVGQEYPIVGANQTPVTSFADGDIIEGEPYRLSMKRTRSELVNTVAGTYVDPEAFYQPMPLATRDDAIALAQDRERLAVPLTFSVVTVPACVDRLADIALRASRYQASASICLRHKYLALKPGQWVTWASARHGWTKTFLVVSKRLGAFGPRNARAVYVALQEVGAGVFDPTAYKTTPPDGIQQGAPDYLSEVQNFIAAGIAVNDPDTGNQYPALRLSWDDFDDKTVTGVDIRYRVKAQPGVILTDAVKADQVVVTVANGVVSNTWFEVSTRLVTSPYRVVPWSAWTEVLTPKAPMTDISVVLSKLGSDVRSVLENVYANMGEMRERIEQLALAGADEAQTITKSNEIAVRHRHAVAGVIQEIRAAISDEDGELIAVATALTAIMGQVGDLFAEGLFRMEARAGGGNVLARIVMMVRAGDEESWEDAGLILEVFSEGGVIKSRVLVNGNQFVVTDGSSVNLPLLYEAGVLTLAVGRIKEAIVDLLKTPTSKARFGLLAPGIEGLEITT